jgi:hypothetical protein
MALTRRAQLDSFFVEMQVGRRCTSLIARAG